MTQEAIEVRGARVNNLKNISFSIPINQMTVVTGVSGSGKSSLAFDTIYAEGQRKYVESLSVYAKSNVNFVDALALVTARRNGFEPVTFDEQLKKLASRRPESR